MREKIDPGVAAEFLAQRRLAVVGVSDKDTQMGNSVWKELRGHGIDAVAVGHVHEIEGDPVYGDLASIPAPPVDGVIVMVRAAAAAAVVQQALDLGISRVWLFKGAGPGAVSDEAIALCREHGIPVVAGACPLMFLEPVTSVHKFHYWMRRLNGGVAKKRAA